MHAGFYAVASAESMQDHGIGYSAAQSVVSRQVRTLEGNGNRGVFRPLVNRLEGHLQYDIVQYIV